MIVNYIIEIVFMLAILFLTFKICQLINTIIKEYRDTEKMRRDILRLEKGETKKRLNEVKK